MDLKTDFLEEQGKRKIDRRYTMAEQERDVPFAKGIHKCTYLSIASFFIPTGIFSMA